MISLLFADEMARIESIVKDVSVLRQKYEACQDKLDQIESAPKQCAVNELELKARHQEILTLEKENESLKNDLSLYRSKMDAKLTQIIAENEIKITHFRDENKRLQEEIEKLQAGDMTNSKSVIACACEATFPKLTMKPGFEHLQEPQKSKWSSSKTYRLKHEAKIYDAIRGKVLETWKARRSFTSMYQKQDWIRITGYFVDRKWRSARNESLWVKAEDAFLRVKK